MMVPSMFLRHLGGFDTLIYLEVSPSIGIQRKINRDKTEGNKRDPLITKKIVELIEFPAMQEYFQRFSKEGLLVDTNNLNNLIISRQNGL